MLCPAYPSLPVDLSGFSPTSPDHLQTSVPSSQYFNKSTPVYTTAYLFINLSDVTTSPFYILKASLYNNRYNKSTWFIIIVDKWSIFRSRCGLPEREHRTDPVLCNSLCDCKEPSHVFTPSIN